MIPSPSFFIQAGDWHCQSADSGRIELLRHVVWGLYASEESRCGACISRPTSSTTPRRSPQVIDIAPMSVCCICTLLKTGSTTIPTKESDCLRKLPTSFTRIEYHNGREKVGAVSVLRGKITRAQGIICRHCRLW